MKSKHAWNSLWICVGIWVIATMYQIVLESPFFLHLQRLEQIEKDHAPLVTKAEELMQEQESLKAEFNQQTSVSSMLAGFGKSFWDGMTFGAFAKEGIFTEYNKFDRWATDVSKRDAIQSTKAQQILSKMKVLQEEYLQIQPVAVSEYNRYRFCEIAKSWAFLIGIVSIIVAVVLRFRKQNQPGSPAERHVINNPVTENRDSTTLAIAEATIKKQAAGPIASTDFKSDNLKNCKPAEQTNQAQLEFVACYPIGKYFPVLFKHYGHRVTRMSVESDASYATRLQRFAKEYEKETGLKIG